MENKRKLVGLLMTLILLLVLAFGSVAPGLADRIAEPWVGSVEVWTVPSNQLCPMAGGSSGT